MRRNLPVIFIQQFNDEQFGLVVAAMAFGAFGERRLHLGGRIG